MRRAQFFGLLAERSDIWLGKYPPMAYREAIGLQTVVETPEFLNGVADILSDAERTALIDYLARNPLAGDVMQGTGGARKLRWAAKGKGKSGGARVITFYSGSDLPVFVMAIFGKAEKANLSKAERNDLRDILMLVAKKYREKQA